MEQPLWTPGPDRIEKSNLTGFISFVNKGGGMNIDSYDELYDWSVRSPERFWESIWDYSDILHSQPHSAVLEADGMLGAQWFTGARLNFAENLLRTRDDRPALTSVQNGNSASQTITYTELYEKAARLAHFLTRQGIQPGDRVAGLLPNRIEAVVGMLAATGIGAIWSSCSPDFGFNGVIQRFEQIEPKILLTTDGYFYGEKTIDCVEKSHRVIEAVASLETVVLVPYTGERAELDVDADVVQWADALDNTTTEMTFAQLPFDHPVYIMYSSGTTGVPKCMVHGCGGTLLQHSKELRLHCDLKKDDTIFYYTTCGWMMWNWLVSSLMCGSHIVLYDGNPLWPEPDILWRMCEEQRISHFGTSAKYISLCMKNGVEPGKKYRLEHLRSVLSTGSPLSTDGFEWVYSHVKKDLHLASISGGTDIISCFILGDPTSPVYPGQIQKRGLGMRVEAWNSEGRPVVGEKGELVCTRPFPSMPVSFWNDPDNAKYISAYFDFFPGVWRHGDFIEITEQGGIIVHGRSDATLNPGGIRLGTAELYRAAESLEEVVDSIAIGQQYEGDVRIVLFIVLAEDAELDDRLRQKIKAHIRSEASPHHVPAVIAAVPEIPMTINGKKVEMAVTKVVHDEEVTNRDSLLNPEALEYFRGLPELG